MFNVSDLLYIKEIDADWLAEVITERFDNALDLMTEHAMVYGGALRDSLAGIPLQGDLDIAVPPEELEEIVERFQSSSKWMVTEKDGEQVSIPNPNPIGVRDCEKRRPPRESTVAEAVVGRPGRRSALFPNSSGSGGSGGMIFASEQTLERKRPTHPIKKSPKSPYKKGRGKTVLSGVFTFEMSGGIKVQIMAAKKMEGMLEAMASDPRQVALCPARAVDLRCCGLAMDKHGHVFEVVKGAYNDCQEKMLRLNKLTADDSFTHLSERVEKLTDRGWASEIDLGKCKKEIDKLKRKKSIEQKRKVKREKKRFERKMRHRTDMLKNESRIKLYNAPREAAGIVFNGAFVVEAEIIGKSAEGDIIRLFIPFDKIQIMFYPHGRSKKSSGSKRKHIEYITAVRRVSDELFDNNIIETGTTIRKNASGYNEEVLYLVGTEERIAGFFTLINEYWKHYRNDAHGLKKHIEKRRGIDIDSVPNSTDFRVHRNEKKDPFTFDNESIGYEGQNEIDISKKEFVIPPLEHSTPEGAPVLPSDEVPVEEAEVKGPDLEGPDPEESNSEGYAELPDEEAVVITTSSNYPKHFEKRNSIKPRGTSGSMTGRVIESMPKKEYYATADVKKEIIGKVAAQKMINFRDTELFKKGNIKTVIIKDNGNTIECTVSDKTSTDGRPKTFSTKKPDPNKISSHLTLYARDAFEKIKEDHVGIRIPDSMLAERMCQAIVNQLMTEVKPNQLEPYGLKQEATKHKEEKKERYKEMYTASVNLNFDMPKTMTTQTAEGEGEDE